MLYEVIQLEPIDSAAYSKKGSALSELKKYDDAIQFFDKAIQLDPNHLNKSNTLGDMERHNEAIQFYDKATNIGSNNIKPYFYKGNALCRSIG